ncbi:MAG: hypothetical protein CL678_16515 [Bdellovibrionaceae bacterium]|nr:hypothetical protein [Pseudobdellovibrionaceae bacterium]|tara:strand:+ start:2273 stop:3247 length:975 start_codon:yes stop_codon:yes gene_type:complete
MIWYKKFIKTSFQIIFICFSTSKSYADVKKDVTSAIEESFSFVPLSLLEKAQISKISIRWSSAPVSLHEEEKPTHARFIPQDNPSHILIEIHPGLKKVKSLIAHEWFHGFHYSLVPQEETWLKEGMAQTFEYLLYHTIHFDNLMSSEKIFERNPFFYNSFEGKKRIPYQYGLSFLWTWYLISHCSNEKPKDLFFKILEVDSKFTGIKRLKEALKNTKCDSIENTYLDFQVARILNQKIINEKDIDLKFFLINETKKVKHKWTSLETLKTLSPWSPAKLEYPLSPEQNLVLKNKKFIGKWIHLNYPYEESILPKNSYFYVGFPTL